MTGATMLMIRRAPVRAIIVEQIDAARWRLQWWGEPAAADVDTVTSSPDYQATVQRALVLHRRIGIPVGVQPLACNRQPLRIGGR